MSAFTWRDGALWLEGKRFDYGQIVSRYLAMPGGELVGRGYVRPVAF